MKETIQPKADQLTASVFALLTGLTIYFTLILIRFPESVNNRETLQLGLVGASYTALLLFAPILLNRLLSKFKFDAPINTEPVLFAIIFLCSVVLGKVLPADFNAAGAITALGIISLLGSLPMLKGASWTTMTFSLSLGIWLAGIAFSDKHHSAFFMEQLSRGASSIDTLFHASMVNMLISYGKFSAGIDGTVFTQYHIGSHWIYAQLCKLLGIDSLRFYLVGFYLIIIPIILKCFLTFIQLVASSIESEKSKPACGERKLNNLVYLVFTLGCMGILPHEISTKLAIWTDIFFGESYGISMALAFTFASICIVVFHALHSKESHSRENTAALVLATAFAAMACGASFLAKFPIGAIALLLSGYLLVRLNLFKNALFMAGYILSLGLSCWGYLTFRFPYQFKFEPFGFYSSYVGANLIPHLIFYLLWFWMFLLLSAKRLPSKNLQSLKSSFRERKTVLLELMIITLGIGLLAVATMNLAGGSLTFFYDPQYWLGLILCCALIGSKTQPFPKLLGTGLSILLLINSTCAINDLLQYRKAVLNTAKPNGADFLIASEHLSTLKKLNKLPTSEKRKCVIFIPQSTKAYWSLLPPLTIPFVVPALTGIASIDGLPPKGAEGTLYYGYANFAYGVRQPGPQNKSIEYVCFQARARGFKRIIWLSDMGENYQIYDSMSGKLLSNPR